METAIVGIDVGAKGSFCLLIPNTKQVAFMPTTSKPVDLLAWISQIQEEYNLKVIMIEDVHSIFNVSAKSNFSFGYNAGIVNSISSCSGATVDLVQPKKWQKAIGVKKKGKEIKKEVAGICERLYPNVNVRGPRGGLLDGLSDSLMIAHYAYLNYK